jgi:hypothetical protein
MGLVIEEELFFLLRDYRIGKKHKNTIAVSFLHKNSCIKLSQQQHIYSKTMAASTTSLSSSRGFSSKAQFVAGSRRPVSKRIVSRRNNNDVIVRAAAGGKKEEEKVCGENKADESTIAGKAVSAVVAAAISLSSAGQAAVAQVVRSFVVVVFALLSFVFDSSTIIKKRAIRYRKESIIF